jgi:hypothetical protein
MRSPVSALAAGAAEDEISLLVTAVPSLSPMGPS